ncbi:MAG: metal ABC transporter permease, partial [Planctomycetaceae bacterium]|nr:metal ABC transporter permease [Planctomycetaceae bacterium]
MIDWPFFLDPIQRQAFWTILVGISCNSCCALLGCFLVLRRMSMLGDAISHAVLPGLVIAFIVTSTTNALPMFIGAAIFAMLTAGLSRLLSSFGQTSEESGLGIVFTSLFALGILLIQMYAGKVHLDRDAVLEGAIDFVTLDTTEWLGLQWPASLGVTCVVLACVIIWLLLFWKEIKAASFDPVYASAIGLHGHAMLAILVILVALCVVASFKIVGCVLVVAMLVVPAASAQLICHQLFRMLLVAVLFAIAATVSGYYAAWYLNTNSAGMM